MAIVFTHAGKKLDVDDVPMDVYADIEKTTSVPWYRLAQAPAAQAAAGPLLAKQCAKILGVELPDPITPRVLVSLFDVDDTPNTPTEFADGVPDPLVEDSEAATT